MRARIIRAYKPWRPRGVFFFVGKSFLFCFLFVVVKKILLAFVSSTSRNFFLKKLSHFFHSTRRKRRDNQECFFLPRSLYGAWLREMRKRG